MTLFTSIKRLSAWLFLKWFTLDFVYKPSFSFSYSHAESLGCWISRTLNLFYRNSCSNLRTVLLLLSATKLRNLWQFVTAKQPQSTQGIPARFCIQSGLGVKVLTKFTANLHFIFLLHSHCDLFDLVNCLPRTETGWVSHVKNKLEKWVPISPASP